MTSNIFSFFVPNATRACTGEMTMRGSQLTNTGNAFSHGTVAVPIVTVMPIFASHCPSSVSSSPFHAFSKTFHDSEMGGPPFMEAEAEHALFGSHGASPTPF